jgi:hypothetical protein
MATIRATHTTPKMAHAGDEAGNIRDLLADEQVKTVLYEGKPVTVWEVATRLGNIYIEQVSAILDGLTSEGILSRFRAGFNNYYAPPKVALTGEEPTFKTVISDSVKDLFLNLRYKAARKPN